jgi:hypothetical protein
MAEKHDDEADDSDDEDADRLGAQDAVARFFFGSGGRGHRGHCSAEGRWEVSALSPTANQLPNFIELR